MDVSSEDILVEEMLACCLVDSPLTHTLHVACVEVTDILLCNFSSLVVKLHNAFFFGHTKAKKTFDSFLSLAFISCWMGIWIPKLAGVYVIVYCSTTDYMSTLYLTLQSDNKLQANTGT